MGKVIIGFTMSLDGFICQPVTEADAETPNALDPPNTGSELRAEQARVSGFVGYSANRREPQFDRCRNQALFFEMNPIAQNDGPAERQARLRAIGLCLAGEQNWSFSENID